MHARSLTYALITYVTVHAKRVIFAHLTEIEFLISFESLDTATLNSASSGFISVSVLKLWHLKWISSRATHSRKQVTSVHAHIWPFSHGRSHITVFWNNHHQAR